MKSRSTRYLTSRTQLIVSGLLGLAVLMALYFLNIPAFILIAVILLLSFFITPTAFGLCGLGLLVATAISVSFSGNDTALTRNISLLLFASLIGQLISVMRASHSAPSNAPADVLQKSSLSSPKNTSVPLITAPKKSLTNHKPAIETRALPPKYILKPQEQSQDVPRTLRALPHLTNNITRQTISDMMPDKPILSSRPPKRPRLIQ